MKKWILILICLFLLIIDNSLMPFLSIKGAYPSLLFIFAVAYSIISGRKEAIIIGVISGVLQDIYFSQIFGLNALINMLICLISAVIGENIYIEKKFVPTVAIVFLYLVKILGIGIIFKLINKSINMEIGMYTSLYSGVIMFLVYNSVLRLCDIDNKKKSWRFR